MKLKKYLTVLLLSIACLCIGFAFGCQTEKDPEFTVDFAAGEHVKFIYGEEEITSGQKVVKKNEVVEFGVVVDYGYENPVVKVNDYTLVADNGRYSVVISENTTITASVSEDRLTGAGTSEEDPFLIDSLRDLRYIADMVNSGYSSYIMGYYKLTRDIDCGGEALDVIGHFESPNAYFAGNFNGDNHTISNYTITKNGRTYVGLFGCVQATTTAGTGIITNLNLKDFTLSATAADDGVVCVGPVVAFAVGASIVNCGATDGVIRCYGNNMNFSFAGGAIGVQQSVTLQSAVGPVHYLCSSQGVHTDVNIITSGFVFAGGIVGHSVSSHERAPATILNSYAEGDVTGAMRSGGIVGWLDDYSSVANCYSTSYVSATVSFLTQMTDNNLFAYAGGIAGYAGKGSVITDSFSKASTYADSTNAGSATGDIVGFSVPSTALANGVTIENCYFGNSANGTNADFVKNSLHWNECDWIIANGALPVLNLENIDNRFAVTLNFGSRRVDGDTTKAVNFEIKNDEYLPFSFYLGDKFDEYVSAVDSSDKANLSYGYFFDSACTNKVPYGYILTREITLYVGFADYSEVSGTYEFTTSNGRTVELVMNDDGTYSYIDVRNFGGASYTYDGEKLILNDGLFARLSPVVAVENGVSQPASNFEPYTFIGTFSNGSISLYDGNYFTEDSPLTFTSPTVKPAVNDFVGTWERSATLNETYTFNADGNWSYKWKNTVKSGTYTVTNGVATLSGGLSTQATIDASGLLSIGGKLYSLENSFFGLWFSPETGIYLRLNGFGTGLGGDAVASIDGTLYDSLAYVKDGFFDHITETEYTYTVIGGYSLFGYFTYDPASNVITLMAYDGDGMREYTLYLIDDYSGEWIGEDTIGNVAFTLVNFNGLGIYKSENNGENGGYIEINGERVPYECTVESGLEGKFEYNGVTYTLTVNDDGTVTVSGNGATASLFRKDEMYSLPLIDADNTVYEFNGGGKLTGGGVLTVTPVAGETKEYRYKIVSGAVFYDEEVGDIRINVYGKEDTSLSTAIGSISISGSKFVLSMDGKDDVSLDLYLTFADKTWAISSINNSFYIGRFDLTYQATGMFNGVTGVTFDYYPEYNYIEIYHTDIFQSENSFHIYLLLLNDGNLAVSSYPYLVSGDYSYAAPVDDVFGSWANTVDGNALSFDGLADSMYTTGVAFYRSQTYLYTRRFGTLYMWLYNDETTAYTVSHLYEDVSGENIFLKSGGNRFDRLLLEETDVLSGAIFTATDADGTEYGFNFDGTITVGGEEGTYLLREVDGNTTTVVIEVDGTETVVVVDHVNHTVTVA